MSKSVDIIIVGQGIAGTTLAWNLLESGLSILIVDRSERVTSSRVAAGLMTPVTGKRLATMPDWQQYWSEALEFYRNVENLLKTRFFEEKQMLRLFQSEDERNLYEHKQKKFARGVCVRKLPSCPKCIHNHFGGFEMSGGQLRVAKYLDASRKYFQSVNSYTVFDLDIKSDVQFDSEKVSISKLNVESPLIICCQGFQQNTPIQFETVRFNPCKGEILTVEIEDFEESRTFHQGIWLAQLRQNEYQVGATYDWNDLTHRISEAGRNWITVRLHQLMNKPFNVLDQQTAVRPTMQDFQPVIGIHPHGSRLGMMNGLGSKGSLLAPRLAKIFSQNLLNGTPIPNELSLARWFD